MPLYEKRPGAPTGSLTVQVGQGSYVFTDGGTVTVTDPVASRDLDNHPFTRRIGGSEVTWPYRGRFAPSVLEDNDPTPGDVLTRTSLGFEFLTPAPDLAWHRTGTFVTNMPKHGTTLQGAFFPVSGRVSIVGGMILPPGFVVNRIGFETSNTAAAGLSHCWFGLVDPNSMTFLATTNDSLTAPWLDTDYKELTLPTPYVAPAAQRVYVAIMLTGTTMPSLYSHMNTNLQGLAATSGLVMNAHTALTGQTTPLPVGTPVGALTVSTITPFCWAAT